MIANRRQALLAIDLQRSFCDAGGSMARQGRDITSLSQAARACNDLAAAARTGGVPVVWTRMVFNADYSDGGELIRSIRPNLKRIGALARGSGDEELSELVRTAEPDIVIDKPRFSALVGTSLEVLLRSGGIDDVIVCGVTTSMCVESTVRDLGQRDYRVSVVRDACADLDEARHAAALASMEFGFAKIISRSEAAATMGSS